MKILAGLTFLGNGEVDFDEFCEIMAKKTAEQGEVDIETELKDVFKIFDRL